MNIIIYNEIGFYVHGINTRNMDLFVIPKYNTNSGNSTFFSRALVLANKISTKLDFFVLSRNIFRIKALKLIRSL
jgi:hypothetical protein